MEILNPYHSDSDSLAPFAGRQAALMRLDHYLKESASSSALVFLSCRWQGKTALLRRFESTYDDAFVNVYLPLKHLSLASDDDLFQAILQGSGHSIAQRDITLTRLPAAELDQEDLRIWLDQTWLPGVAQVIRPHRKLVLLLDDADQLLRAMDEERLPADSLVFLDQLMHQHPLLKLVFTFPGEREDDLTRFGALYSPSATLRLTNLALDECAWLLQSPPSGHYRVTHEAVQLVQQATGGHPLFVQRFGFRIFENYEHQRDAATITPDIIKSLTPSVYQDSSAELDAFWRDFNR